MPFRHRTPGPGCQRPRAARLRMAIAVALAVGLVALPTPAGATWSIATTDPGTGAAGVALASCVSADVLGDPLGPLLPLIVDTGTAAVVQGQFNLSAPERIRELAATGAGAADVVDDLADVEDDPGLGARQYAVVDRNGVAAAFSGDGLTADAGDRQGDSVTVQGNVLASEQVLDASLEAFEASRDAGGSLVQSLARGLLAGSRAGGDRRCEGQTALFAQVVVVDGSSPAATPRVVTVVVDRQDGQNPVELLAEAVEQGRVGLIDAGRGDEGSGAAVQIVAGLAALVMAGLGVLAFRAGMGSRGARRSRR